MQHTEIVIPPYSVLVVGNGLPDLYDHYCENAQLVDEHDLSSEETACFFGIGLQSNWPSLVVAQRYSPSSAGFHPGILLVPETSTVFIGAGDRLLAYQLEPTPTRLWIDHAKCGFWSWSRHGEYVLLSAELELAAWTLDGVKRWTTFVEPPWVFNVSDGTVELDVMGEKSSFPIATGP